METLPREAGHRRPQDLAATIYHALDVPLDVKLGKDGFSKPIVAGEPLLKLFG